MDPANPLRNARRHFSARGLDTAKEIFAPRGSNYICKSEDKMDWEPGGWGLWPHQAGVREEEETPRSCR